MPSPSDDSRASLLRTRTVHLRVLTPATLTNANLVGWPDALRYKGSVIPTIMPSILVVVLSALLVCVLHFRYHFHLHISGAIIPSFSVVLGLLLVFRTNTAYERYWEGRKLWGMLLSELKTLARVVWLQVPEDATRTSKAEKRRALDIAVAVAVATKRWLRDERGTNWGDLYGITPRRFGAAKTPAGGDAAPVDSALYGTAVIINDAPDNTTVDCDSPVTLPSELLYHLSIYATRIAAFKTDNGTAPAIQCAVNAITQIHADMDRVLSTPIPLAYRIHMKQACLIYCLTLPFTLLNLLGWITIPVTAAVAFTLFGIDGIGAEIENPFGYDANDLDLDEMCESLRREISWLRREVPAGGAKVSDKDWAEALKRYQ